MELGAIASAMAIGAQNSRPEYYRHNDPIRRMSYEGEI
jgi:hypothetical protein